jgi:hypothetical protein
MGFTRDPYFSPGVGNMWVNIGKSQFHLPTAKSPQVVRGHVGLVLPSRAGLLERLAEVKADLDDTAFAFTEHDEHVEVISPWGNVLRCYEPAERFGRIDLGMPYVEFEVARGTAAAIARFYDEIFATRTSVDSNDDGLFATCSVGNHQSLVFREQDKPLPPYDGHHIQIYLADFSGPHRRLGAHDLVSAENGQWEYRFVDIVDLETGEVVFNLEHEVRSMTNPLYARPLVNRNPDLTGQNFSSRFETLPWSPVGA